MKTLFSTLIVILLQAMGIIALHAQTKIPDTLYANDHEQVALFFPNPISQAVTGASHMVFTYNKELPQQLGLLQAKEGVDSNLLVIDSKGNFFSFALKYKNQLDHFNYFFSAGDAVGSANTHPEKKDSCVVSQPGPYYKDFAGYLMQKARGTLRRERNSKLLMRVKEIVFHKEDYFFVMEIDNRSGINFQPQGILFSRATKTQGKRKSMQQLPIKILKAFDFPANVPAGTQKRFVIMVPKFTLSRDKELQIRIFELNGTRNIRLKLFQKHLDKVVSM